MSRRFQQLAAEERVALAALRLQGHSLRGIARQLGRSPSTLSREVRRNATVAGYASAPAQKRFEQRRLAARSPAKFDPDAPLWPVVSHLLGWC
jgi:transposase, IS30 family